MGKYRFRLYAFILFTFLVTLFLSFFVPTGTIRRAIAEDLPSDAIKSDKKPIITLQIGFASFMADEIHGRMTANGELYDMRQLVAAHRTLPFNTIVDVRNLENNKLVRVRINDRGPYIQGRIIDLSFEAAKELDLIQSGSALVEVHIIQLGTRSN